MKTQTVDLPLHWGKAPDWLMDKMAKLAKQILIVIVTNYGEEELLCRLAHPIWFQSLGCALGFDWHSSGITTTLTAALKKATSEVKDLGIFITGGKGKYARNTPKEIEMFSKYLNINPEDLILKSRLSAKVDNACLQDGYTLYHHCFIFTKSGSWAVIQQGMNEISSYARRYHWLNQTKKEENSEEFLIEEPHTGICCDKKEESVLDLTSKKSRKCRQVILELVKELNPDKLMKEFKLIVEKNHYHFPTRHYITSQDLKYLSKIFLKTYEYSPENFQELLGIKNLGRKALRALALLAELIAGAKPSYEDPVRFSFCHGGKDGYPYKLDRRTYQSSIDILKEAIEKAKIGDKEKLNAIMRLSIY